MNKKRIFAFLLCFAMSATSISLENVMAKEVSDAADAAYDIFVAVDGSDTEGDGSEDKPYATLDKAKEAARELDKDNGSVRVSIGEGKYFVNDSIEFSAEDSNVTYVGNNAVLSGAKTLSDLKWDDYDRNIKVASVEAGLGIDQLFISGEQQTLARYPNYDAEQVLQGSTTQEDIKARSANWNDPASGYIRALHQNKWGGNSYRIIGKDNSALGLTYEWIGDNNRGSGMLSSAIMVENIFEELDETGEWYYDEEGKLYVYPKEGVNLDECVIEGAVTEEILHVEGIQGGEQVTNLTFDGLTLENTKRTMFTGQYVPLMRGDWCVVRSGALFIQDAENVTFKNGMLRNIGGNGIFLSGHSKNVLIDNNEIINIGSSGIQVVGFPDSCREPSFWEYTEPLEPEAETFYIHKTTIEDTTPGPAAEHYPREAMISNNHIQNVGIWEKQSSQVALSVAYKIQVLHNTLHEGPRAGINVGDGTFGGHELAYNDIFDVQKETDDHGMFNSWGRDRFWSLGGYDTLGNNGAEKEPYSLLDVIDPIEIHDNRMHFGGRLDGGSTFGIDLDDGSTNYKIYNNLCLNMGIKLREGFHRKVYNNILVNGQINLHCTYEDSYDVIERNIVVKGSPYSLSTTDEPRFKVSEDKIDNNWFYDLGMKTTYPDFWENLGYDENSVNTDPQFKDTSLNDYTVMNEVIMEQIGFENFPMDQFGKPGCEYQAPVYEKTEIDGSQDILEREEWLGTTISAVDAAIMSSTGAGGLDGVYMEKVPKDSRAALYGFKTGDVLKSLNGEIIGKKSSFTPKYNAIEAGSIVNVKIVRNQTTVSLNFVKTEQEEIIDDQSLVIKYSGGTWEESTPDYNASNAADCIDQTLTAINVSYADDPEQISVEVPFYGTQIEFFTRKESNMGEYKIVIEDEQGKKVQEATCSAYIDGKKDAQLIFKSEILPQGNKTLRLTRISGDYVIVDAFKVYSQPEEKIDSVVTEPVAVTDDGVRVTELPSEKELDIQIPLKNNGKDSVDITASAILSGNDGALQMELLTEKDITLGAGENEEIQLSVTTPENSVSKRLEIYVYGKESGQPYAYSYTVDGRSIVHKDVTILDASGSEIGYTYTNSEHILTIAAGGFSEGGQALIQIDDENGGTVVLRQTEVEESGQVKAAFILPEEYSGQIILKIRDEKGIEKTSTVEVGEGKDVVYKSGLEKAAAKAADILNTSGNQTLYTKDSWMRLYNAYYQAMSVIESDTVTQEEIIQITLKLEKGIEDLQFMEEEGEYIPSQQNRGEGWQVYNHDGAEDGGDFDNEDGDWMVRADHIDTTVQGAYAEFKGNFTAFAIEGANKEDSADFKVVIKDETTGEETTKEISLSRSGYHEVIYEEDELSGNHQTIRIYHNDGSQEKRYLELWKVSYMENADDAQPVSELTGIKITKLPDKTEYQKGVDEEISLLGGEVTETYSDGSENVIPMNSSMYESGFDMAEAGNKTIIVAHREQTVSFEIIVKNNDGEPSDAADKTALKLAIDVAEKLEAEQAETGCYTEESWAAAQEALDSARAVLENLEAAQKEVDQAFLNLITACNLLENQVQSVGLKAAIDGAKAVLADTERLEMYTPESVEVVRTALLEAESVYALEAADQETVNAAARNLMDAVTSLLVVQVNTRLDILIQKAEALLVNKDQYTQASIEKLETALEAAKETASNSKASQEEINKAYNTLSEAMASLVRKAEKSELKTALDKANEILADSGSYVKETIAGLQAVTDETQVVYDKDDADASEVGDAVKKLVEEILKARLLGDVDGNGSVDSADSAEVLKYAAESQEFDEVQNKAADVNRDGTADSSDAALILQFTAEMIEEF